ncbi:MAG: phosphate ABC transporter substrate-binding protein PstS [Chthoniobacterales bacterium]
MKKIIGKSLLQFTVIIGFLIFLTSASAITLLNGSGATFPAPLYQRWAAEFHKRDSSIAINYQGVGSGAGIADFTRGLTDFSASDVAMTDQEIAAIHGNVLMIPMTGGMIVLSYNIPGVENLRLSRAAYVGIFLGTITQWNDPLIIACNPEIKLPDTPITVMTRSDGSGTTAIITEHLAAISPLFSSQVGVGKSVKWPVGLAAKGNGGVTSLIKRTIGGIGYIEFGFATGNHLPMASLENKMGEFIPPSFEAGCKALATMELPSQSTAIAATEQSQLKVEVEANKETEESKVTTSTDHLGSGNYPITGLSWFLLKKEYSPEKNSAIKAFMNYALTQGQSLAPILGYLTLPPALLEKSKAAVALVNSTVTSRE